tara:strand:- start:2728 stop:2958 length:231 start_codon:yes stop_codon:yes gene_type:complete
MSLDFNAKVEEVLEARKTAYYDTHAARITDLNGVTSRQAIEHTVDRYLGPPNGREEKKMTSWGRGEVDCRRVCAFQ